MQLSEEQQEHRPTGTRDTVRRFCICVEEALEPRS